jgi:hypothetical protein
MTERDLFLIEYTSEKDQQVFDLITDIKFGMFEYNDSHYGGTREVFVRKHSSFRGFMPTNGQEVRELNGCSRFQSQVARALKAGFLIKYPMRVDIANNVLDFVLSIVINKSNDDLLKDDGIDRQAMVIYISEALDGLNQKHFEVAE